MKILISAKQKGYANVLAPVARELITRGHEVTVYATGNTDEAKGFQDLSFQSITPTLEDCSRLVDGYEAVLVGFSGYNTGDGLLLRAANAKSIPTVAAQCQNRLYLEKLGIDLAGIPTALALMSDDCIDTVRKDFSVEGVDPSVKDEIERRCKVVGWAAYDHYAQMRESFTAERRAEVLKSIGVDPEKPAFVHLTQNMHPRCPYRLKTDRPYELKVKEFLYEQGVTQFTFEAASDLGLKLVVKPHPGELHSRNYTKELAERHGFTFVPASACDTAQLMLAAYSVTAGRSTSLIEATLLDRNAAGLIPDLGEDDINAIPPMQLRAIPYTQQWSGIKDVLAQVTSADGGVMQQLSQDRKKFSVDGKAAARLSDLIESLS